MQPPAALRPRIELAIGSATRFLVSFAHARRLPKSKRAAVRHKWTRLLATDDRCHRLAMYHVVIHQLPVAAPRWRTGPQIVATPPNLAVLLAHCGQLIRRKISKFDAIRYQILRLKCTKFDFRCRVYSLPRSPRPRSCISWA